MKKMRCWIQYIISIIILAALFHADGGKVFPERVAGELYMYVIDVGQADSTLILLPDGENILIDAGNRDDAAFLKKFIKERGVEKMDYVVATPPHEDHIGAMSEIIESFEIGIFFMPDAVNTTSCYEDMINSLVNENVIVETAQKGVILKEGDCKIEILSPNEDVYEDFNHVSAVTKITYLDTSFLIMGDAEKINENEMLENNRKALKSTVLRLGHHGSNTSSSKKFLQVVDPEIAVISVGEGNDYGHPHKEVKARLKKLKIPYYRTDESGTILIVSDGDEIEVIEEREDETDEINSGQKRRKFTGTYFA